MRPDDPFISGDLWLLRVLIIEGWWKSDGQKVRATSLAFMDGRSGEVSCYVDTSERRAQLKVRYQGSRIGRFTASEARLSGFNVTRDPEGDPEHNPEHIVLTFIHENLGRKSYQRAAKQLALLCEVI